MKKISKRRAVMLEDGIFQALRPYAQREKRSIGRAIEYWIETIVLPQLKENVTKP